MSDPWTNLKQATEARIALGRCGVSLPLAESLGFKLAHARARDAVLQPFQVTPLLANLKKSGIPAIELQTQVEDRSEFLTRPDLGRKLSEQSADMLSSHHDSYELCIVISNGLSSPAIHDNALPFLQLLLPTLQQAGLSLSPICIVENGRVAVADEIGSLLGATATAILIGERPGLSSPNSLGIYLTHHPEVGTTDECRNCISNIRQGGLPIHAGVQKLCYLLEEALRLQVTGVQLKDRMRADYLPFGKPLPALLDNWS